MDGPTSLKSVEGATGEAVAYRLRSGVRTQSLADSRPLLVLNYPLRAIALQPCWRPLLKRMAPGDFISMEELASSVSDIPVEKTAAFLERLVRKAFCDRRGIERLSEYPKVSLVIPVRNRREDLSLCLESLSRLQYPKQKTEIIVVDDASSDDSLQVAARFPVKTISVKIHRQVSYCRNLAARQAKGEILAFIDSDCVADPLWLNELVPAFRDHQVGAVGGLVDSYFDEKGLDRYEKVKSSLQVSTWFKRTTEKEPFFYVPSCNLLIRRNLFLDLGGFREDLHVGEDVDLCWRLQRHGAELEYRPVGTVYHKHRNQLGAFCRRRFQYGTSEPILQQLHPDRPKQFLLPWPEFLFLIFAACSAWFSCLPLLGLAAAALIFQFYRRNLELGNNGIPVSRLAVARTVIRTSLALFYHACLFVSRYYLVGCVILWPLAAWLSAGALAMHALAGIVQFHILRPRLNLLSFLALFSLDQSAYQLGVWWGCCSRSFFKPLLPKLVFSMTGRRISGLTSRNCN